MLPDEIEFIIAKAKLDVELKFNEDQPRDENGRWTDGSGAPGTSPKSLEVAARISDVVRQPSRDIFDDGRRIFHDSEATYTAKSGEQYKLKYTIEESHEGWEGKGDDRHRVYRDAAELSGQVFAYKEGSSDPVGSLTVTGKTEGYGDDKVFLPEMAVDQVVTKPSEQRQGIATAMLEFARAESPVPISHGGAVSDAGQGFIDTVKGITVKYSPDQLRDENGRFTVDGGSGTFKPGRENWKRVDPSELVARDMELQIAAAEANGKPFTEEEIKMHQKWSEMFYQKNFVMKNGSTMVYAQKATPQSDRAGISVTKEDFSNVMQQIDRLQQYAPLDDISVYINGGSDRVAAASALKTGEGTAIQLNLNSMLNDAIMISADKTEGNSMPAETTENSMEFTLAHEWGHAFDYAKSTENNDISLNAALRVAARDLGGGLSDYAKTSNQEMYAELFAQHYMEQVHGMQPIPATQAVSEFLK